MSLVLETGPVAEPLTLAEVKAFLRVDASDEDGLINGLISAARMQVEAQAHLALLTQSWIWRPHAVATQMDLPLGPLQSVTHMTRTDAEPVSPESYTVTAGRIGRIRWNGTPPAADSGLTIHFTAGYGDEGADVPADLRQALKMLVAHWFETREPAFGAPPSLPGEVTALLAPYRQVRL